MEAENNIALTSGQHVSIREKIAKVQQSIGTITKNGVNPHFKNKYATLDEVWNRVKTELKAARLMSYCTTELIGEYWSLTTHIADIDSKEEICGSFPLPANAGPQQVGSAMTYARRYTLCALLQIVTADEDDDGNAAQGKTTPPPNF